jgi:predicted GIY-YIG superfamily endonuclease
MIHDGPRATDARAVDGMWRATMLSLPEDAERHLPTDGEYAWLHSPAVYILALDMPADRAAAWDAVHDHRLDDFDELLDADRVFYVGSSMDVCARLTDHNDGEVRQTALTKAYGIDHIHNIHWFPEITASNVLRSEERTTARLLKREYPNAYVRQA